MDYYMATALLQKKRPPYAEIMTSRDFGADAEIQASENARISPYFSNA